MKGNEKDREKEKAGEGRIFRRKNSKQQIEEAR